nr:hypothetical protein [uncultured Dyadobacter sp.]
MKQLSIRIGGLLAFVLLFCFSCTDHEPGRQPRVITGEAIATPTAPAVSFKVIVEAGDFPIVEYGVVYSLKENANDNDFHTTPTVADTKAIFPLPASNGQHIKVEQVAPFVEMYYRAYAVVQGGAVIYGDVMVIDKDGPSQDNGAKVSTLDILSSNADGTLNFRLNLASSGQTISEFGIVFSSRATPQQPINQNPTVENGTKIVFPMPAMDGVHTKAGLNVNQNPIQEMFYRAYAILGNGIVIYGDALKVTAD